GTGEQQILVFQVLTNHIDIAHRQIIRDRFPRRTVIASYIDIRLPVIGSMSINRDITGPGIEMRGLDARNLIRIAAQALNILCDIAPGRAAIPAQLDVTVVGSDPQYTGKRWRLGYRRYVAIVACPIVL